MNIDTSSLAQSVSQALAALRRADAERLHTVESAYRERLRATRAPARLVDALRRRFGDAAFELACAQGLAPLDANGLPTPPDAIVVQERGLGLRWARGLRPDIEFLAFWDALQAAEAGESARDSARESASTS
jgi:hypothetical protein